MIDEPTTNPHALHAPPVSSGAEDYRFPGGASGGAEHFPAVDERLARPETREEVIDGRKVYAAPSEGPHADGHCRLDYVVTAHVAEGFVAASDLLTRTDQRADFATDCSVRRIGEDPHTGGRFLEELCFEVVNEQSMRGMPRRARRLLRRGVRRVFAIQAWTGAGMVHQASKIVPNSSSRAISGRSCFSNL